MKITDKAVFEFLKSRISDVRKATKEEFGFTGVRSIESDLNELRPDILYVWPESETVGTPSKTEGACILLKQRMLDENPQIQNAMILGNDCSLASALNMLLTLFDKVAGFVDELQDVILVGGGISGLFEVAERYFPNCLIVMTDTAYNITHATKRSVDDVHLNSLLEQGFYSKKNIDLIASHGYFEDWQRTSRPVRYGAEVTVSGKNMLIRSYQRLGFATEFVACYFLSGEPTELDCLMFKRLTDCIEAALLTAPRNTAVVTSEEQLVADLLNESNRKNEVLLLDRCMRLGLPFNCSFRLGVIRSDSATESKAANIAKQLCNYCSIRNYGVFKFRTKVIVVFSDWNYYSVKETSVLEDNWRAFMKSLRVTNSQIGISLGFSSMDYFYTAYQQAERAVAAAAGQSSSKEDMVFFYSDWYLADILSEYEKVMDLDCVCVKQLLSINDGKHNEHDNMTVLYAYLRSERNIAITSRKLDMHRNGVVYRINKIMDMLNLDLDDADTRLRILISYEMLKRLGKFSPTIDDKRDEEQHSPFSMQRD